MAVTRTSSRQAAQKAKEAIASTETKGTAGAKRKETAEKGRAPKRGKKVDQEPKQEEEKKELGEQEEQEEQVREQAPEDKVLGVDAAGAPEKDEKEDEEKAARRLVEQPEKEEKAPAPAPEGEVKEEAVPGLPEKDEKDEKEDQEKATKEHDEPAETPAVEAGVRKSQEREDIVSSNILEKGIIYFFYRPRVNTSEPHGVGDVARSFFVLRPTPIGAVLDAKQGTVEAGAQCRLMIIPKKKFPTTGKERDMGFVEKAGQSMKELRSSFIEGEKYETSTRGERTVQEAKPYAEGVYAITSTKRASHLAYILTIPGELGDVQEDFGLRSRGSWIVQSKNPKYPGPSYAQLPKDPQYPDSVLEKFGDYRWVPLEPEFINYPNAQFLMIGEAADSLGKAATAEPGDKQPDEEQPGEELDKFEKENEERVEALQGDDTVYQDLGLDAKKYPQFATTWVD